MPFIFSFVLVVFSPYLFAFELAPPPQDSVSEAFVDPVSQRKTIIFKKSFEGHRPDGTSDLDFFKQAVQTLQLSPGDDLLVVLQSDGGEISVGLNIHAFLLWLREKGASVTTQIPEGGFCHSICIPVFAAGSQRIANADATFIFHPAEYPEINDPQEMQDALTAAKRHYLNALATADSLFAQFIDQSGALDTKTVEWRASELAQAYPQFLQLYGDCKELQTSVVYSVAVDYELACEALQTVRQSVKQELGYNTDAPVSIEFKESVLFALFDPQGQLVSQEPVYGLYDRKRNHIEMSTFQSSIVQNLDREHFSLKIQTLPLSDQEKKRLLLELHRSIIVHELTHLFTQHNFKDDNPSSAIHEYFSYVIQLKSLPMALLNQILLLNPDVFTNDMQINSMIHFSAPHKFGVMSYKHFENLGERKTTFIEEALSGRFRPDDLLEML